MDPRLGERFRGPHGGLRSLRGAFVPAAGAGVGASHGSGQRRDGGDATPLLSLLPPVMRQ
jgi:hypothetical protein